MFIWGGFKYYTLTPVSFNRNTYYLHKPAFFPCALGIFSLLKLQIL